MKCCNCGQKTTFRFCGFDEYLCEECVIPEKTIKQYQDILSVIEGRKMSETEVLEFLLNYEEFVDGLEIEVKSDDDWEEHA